MIYFFKKKTSFDIRISDWSSDVCSSDLLVFQAQLHDGIRLAAGARVGQADRLHRPEGERAGPALCHHLDRQAALEIGRVLLPLLELGLFGGQQGGMKFEVVDRKSTRLNSSH